MAENSVQNQLKSLDARVHALEERTFLGSLRRFVRAVHIRKEEDTIRIGGWFLLTVSMLGLIRDWVGYQEVNVLFALTFVFGLSLLLRSTHLLTVSDSTRELYNARRATQAVAAHHLHKPATKHRDHNDLLLDVVRLSMIVAGTLMIGALVTFASVRYIADPIWRNVPLLIVLGSALVLAIDHRSRPLMYGGVTALFLVLMSGDAPLFSVICILAAGALFALLAWRRQDWPLLALTSFLGYVSLLRWTWFFAQIDSYRLLPLDSWMLEHHAILFANLIFVVLFVAPFIYRRREVAERGLARLVMIITAVGYATTTTWLSEYMGGYRWFAGLASLLIVLASFGLLSWVRHARYSYAKYFLTLALASVLVGAYVYFDAVGITLLWFMSAVAMLTAGFLLSSYTARWTGILVLALSCLHYLLLILPYSSQYAGNPLLHERVWVGVILSIYLPVLALWFQESPLQGVERKLIPVFTNVFFLTSFLFLFGIIYYESLAPVQSLLFMGLGLVGTLAAVWQRLGMLRTLGLALLGIAVVKFFLIDAQSLSLNWQLGLFALFALVLIVLGLSVHRYHRLLRIYLHF